MNDLMSSCVGHDFWHGASAHFRHLAASRNAPLSLKVVCFMSSKLFSKLGHVYGERVLIKLQGKK